MGAALTVQPGLPVRSHPQEGLQRGDKSGEASGRGCKQLAPRPYTRPVPVPPLPAHPRDNAPSAGLPLSRSTHLFPAPAAGPPLFALHSRGCRGRAAGGGPGMRVDATRPGRRRRSAPGGRRHVGPGHVTRGAQVRVH